MIRTLLAAGADEETKQEMQMEDELIRIVEQSASAEAAKTAAVKLAKTAMKKAKEASKRLEEERRQKEEANRRITELEKKLKKLEGK